MTRDYYLDNILRERWDDAARVVTFWDEAGTQTEQRPYTADENTAADTAAATAATAANKSEVELNLEADLAAMQAIKDQTNAQLREDPSQELKEIAVAVRRLIRMALDDFTGTE